MFNHKAKPPTEAELEYMGRVKLCGCIACWLWGAPYRYAEFDHLLHAGKRIGHMVGLPLCKWHHRGEAVDGMTEKQCLVALGPSKAKGSHPFHAAFGSVDTLLELLKQRLEKFKHDPDL